MKKNFFGGIKLLLFSALFAFVVTLVNRVVNPKYVYRDTWPTTATYLGFYEMPRNSVDVLFFGSSHAASGFDPQQLYDNYGITSYNLGCEQQNLLVSYYWLKEALKYQSPKVIVLDTYMMQWYNESEPLNTAESCTRKAMDYMRWGKVKMDAVRDIGKYDKNQSIWSYYLTNIRFHSRWTGLERSDFTFSEIKSHYETKGYVPRFEMSEEENYEPFSENDTDEQETLMPLMVEYAQKIEELCKQNGIRLILVKNPTIATNVKFHNTVKAFADEKRLEFIDFNEKDNYRKLDFNFSTDMSDGGHPNIAGAAKITDYLGKVLIERYGVVSHKNDVWEATEQYHQELKDIFSLPYETDVVRYLKKLDSNRFSVFISVKDEASFGLSQEAIDAVRALGFEFDMEGKTRYSYIAIKTDEGLYEAVSDQKLSKKDTFQKGTIGYWVVSAGMDCGNISSIQIGGVEYSKNNRGLNIVVYDNTTKMIVDSVCFDTYDAQMPMIR